MTQRADRIWKAGGLERITPHEARHTFATLMIEAMRRGDGQREGPFEHHGSRLHRVTFDRYGHLLPGSETEAAAAFDSYVGDEASALC